MPELNHQTILYAPSLTVLPRNGWKLFVDAEAPNWVSTDERGSWLLSEASQRPVAFAELVARYGRQFNLESGKAWVHAQCFIADALRHRILSLAPVEHPPYQGRAAYLKTSRLREFWLHTNNSCNLSCAHCLVSSSPKGEKGLPTEAWRKIIDQAAGLGVERFYITGGEPFVRQDMPEIIRLITETHKLELIILTNATLFAGSRADMLKRFDPSLVKFQVSVDGSSPAINDPIRGAGSFTATVEGMKMLTSRGFEVTLTTVATGANLEDLPNLTRLAASVGAKNQHLMWVHKRGRVTEEQNGWSHHLPGAAGGSPSPDQSRSNARISQETGLLGHGQVVGWHPSIECLIAAVHRVKEEADRQGIQLDNAASFELRANAPAGIKFDLGNAGWQSLCVYADGLAYPSAAMANHKPLSCGDAANGRSIEQIWKESPVLEQIRQASVIRKAQAQDDPLRFLTGGGDIEHSYFFSGDFLGEDPYYALYRALLLDAMDRLTARKAALVNRRGGYDAPRILHAMGDGAVVCGTTEVGAEDVEVAFLHSNCVLSFNVEKPRKIVQQFYGEAAEKPKAELCCPTKFDASEISHIPQEVIDRFYGCGSPVADANPQPGEVYVDLGSGAGIDCFIAARHVGPTGRVIGVDMTDQMLSVAHTCRSKVAAALGFDVVTFRKGYLEEVPVEDKTADIVTSNCVVNLSPDKPKVFAEIWRILKDHGRAVIADIVSDREVPPRLKVNEQLWGECIVGALTEEQFLSLLEQAGFYGLRVLKKTFWKEIEGFTFYSVTVQGFKFEKTAGCTYTGQYAVYRGPYKAVLDEEGHLFARNVLTRVCTDTASKLGLAPYVGQFTILEPARPGDGKGRPPRQEQEAGRGAGDGSVKSLALSAAACCPPDGGAGGCC